MRKSMMTVGALIVGAVSAVAAADAASGHRASGAQTPPTVQVRVAGPGALGPELIELATVDGVVAVHVEREASVAALEATQDALRSAGIRRVVVTTDSAPGPASLTLLADGGLMVSFELTSNRFAAGAVDPVRLDRATLLVPPVATAGQVQEWTEMLSGRVRAVEVLTCESAMSCG